MGFGFRITAAELDSNILKRWFKNKDFYRKFYSHKVILNIDFMNVLIGLIKPDSSM